MGDPIAFQRNLDRHLDYLHQKHGVKRANVGIKTNGGEEFGIPPDPPRRPPRLLGYEQKRQLFAEYLQKLFRGFRVRQHAKELIRRCFSQYYGENGERAIFDDLYSVYSTYLPQLLFILRSQEEVELKRHEVERFYPSDADLQRLFTACELLVKSANEHPKRWQVCTDPSRVSSKAIWCRLKRFMTLVFWYLTEVWLYMKYSVRERVLLLRTLYAFTEPAVFGNTLTEYAMKTCRIAVFRRILLGVGERVEAEERVWLEKLIFRIGMYAFRTVGTAWVMAITECITSQVLTVPLLWKSLPSLVEKVMVHEQFHRCFEGRRHHFKLFFDVVFQRDPTQINTMGCISGNALYVALKVLKAGTGSLYHSSSRRSGEEIAYLPFRMKFLRVFKDLDEIDKRNIQLLLKNGDRDTKAVENRRHIKELREQIVRYVFVWAGQKIDTFSAEKIDPFSQHPKDKFHSLMLKESYKSLLVVATSEAFADMDTRGMETEMQKLLRNLWGFIKKCRSEKTWPNTGLVKDKKGVVKEKYGLVGAPKWTAPLTAFCSVYAKFLREVTDHQHLSDVMSFKDVKMLIALLKQKLWLLFNADGVERSPSWKQEILRRMSDVLCELAEWNGKVQFTDPESFSVLLQGPLKRDTLMRILKLVPVLLPFRLRDVMYRGSSGKGGDEGKRIVTVTVKRSNLLEDSMDAISRFPVRKLQRRIRVIFVDGSGKEEEVSEGSFKELMEAVAEKAFNPSYGLFKESADHFLYPNPASPQHKKYFEFLGKILGKVMLEGILLDLPFNKVFLKKLMGKTSSVNDLIYLDVELHKNLFALKYYQGSFSELGLHFVATGVSGEDVELTPGGQDKPVTRENVTEYIELMANYLLNTQIAKQCHAFVKGFSQVTNQRNSFMFTADELQQMICGSSGEIDMGDFQKNTRYIGYMKDDTEVLIFWEVAGGFDSEMRKKLLKFVTGVSRAPVQGFRFLKPHFAICKAEGYSDGDAYLPCSSTCENLLKLPPCKNKKVLEAFKLSMPNPALINLLNITESEL